MHYNKILKREIGRQYSYKNKNKNSETDDRYTSIEIIHNIQHENHQGKYPKQVTKIQNQQKYQHKPNEEWGLIKYDKSIQQKKNI